MSGWGRRETLRDKEGSCLSRPSCPSCQESSLVSRAPLAPRVKKSTSHSPIIGAYGGYRKTLSFGYVCLIYHATTLFCKRNYDYKNDALGKTTGQMVGAARSARQNIVEGPSRAGTSKETELRLYDVAKGSLEELAGDYEAFLIDAGVSPWSESDPRVAELAALKLDAFSDEGDGPMRKQVARKGRNAGNPFWSCCNYPNCHGTRKWEG